MRRAARYWFFSVVVVASITILGWLFITPGVASLAELRQHIPLIIKAMLMAMLASVLVLPVILIDLARMSNRFTGPILRLGRAMRQAADGQRVDPVLFRDDDYWQEHADAFNQMLVYLEAVAKSAEAPPWSQGDTIPPREIAS